jgi:hypothetical protein
VTQKTERRHQVRLSLYGELPVRFLDAEHLNEIFVTPVDITPQGLGLLVSPAPQPGESMIMQFLDESHPQILLRCCHSQAHQTGFVIPGMEALRRCGFVVVLKEAEDINLVQIFSGNDSVFIGE